MDGDNAITPIQHGMEFHAAAVVALPVRQDPAGVGVAMKPPQFLKEGDLVRVEIEKLGRLSNRVG